MAAPRKTRKPVSALDLDFVPASKKKAPYEFVLDALSSVHPRTNPMFGCLAVYVGEKIVLALRDKPTSTNDNGVWLATTADHHQSLKLELPCMRSIAIF